jgi:hypothetical protein
MTSTPLDISDKPPVQPRPRSLWRNRDFVLLWSGQLISTAGTQVTSLALPLLILAITHSPAQAGIVAACGSLPRFLLALPAGALVDRCIPVVRPSRPSLPPASRILQNMQKRRPHPRTAAEMRVAPSSSSPQRVPARGHHYKTDVPVIQAILR